MKFEIQPILRFTFMTMAGLLIVGATATWHAIGYLNPFAWIVEWLDVIFAFLCIFLATRTREVTNRLAVYALLLASAAVILIPLEAAFRLPVFVTPNPIHYLIFLIPILFLIFLVIYSTKRSDHRRFASFLFFVSVLGTVMYVAYLFYSYSMRFPTDESVVDLFSAHLFLNGLNPYNHFNISGAFAFYNFPVYANTPLRTGGYVYYLTYPALSFISMIPAAIFGFKGSLLMYPFFAIPIILTWYRGWSRREWFNSVLVLIPFLSLSLYASQVDFSDLNIVWASLMMLSYFVLPRSKTSGFLYGLSLSVKQFPAVTFPFLIYFVYREYGKKKMAVWLIMAIAAFLVVNGYFILLDYQSFVSAMLANETAPLLGVGFSLSQLSFLGYIPIPPVYFSIAMIALILGFITVYVAYYKELKYAFFAFPIIIFLLNYRLFVQYLLYWLVLSLLPLLDLLHAKEFKTGENVAPLASVDHSKSKRANTRNKLVSAVLLLIVVGAVAAGFNQGVTHSPGNFDINSVNIESYNATGYIDEMSVNLTFHGNVVSGTNVLFRFITPEPIGNLNMYLWRPAFNVTLHTGESTTLKIVPLYSIDPVPQNTTYRMIAYYGNAMGSYSGTT